MITRTHIALILIALGLLSSVLLPFDGLIRITSKPKAPEAPDSGCTLANQILAANLDQPVGACRAGEGKDSIGIFEDLVLKEPLPYIESEITIKGNGYTISGDNRHRIFVVRKGSLTIENLSMIDGYAKEGGAILALIEGEVTIRSSEIKGSSAVRGGAIMNRVGSVKLIDSIIRDNRAKEQGGGIYNNAELLIERSSLFGNRAHDGGAVYNDSKGSVEAINSTFSGNRATVRGGALHQRLSDSAELVHVTIKSNRARYGAGLYSDYGEISLVNSIITSNHSGNCVAELAVNINNFIYNDACDPMLTGDPVLYPSAESAEYFTPGKNSPVIGRAHPDYCPATDQRGVDRSGGRSCDLGAIEYAPES